jgi:hypothetical protein
MFSRILYLTVFPIGRAVLLVVLLGLFQQAETNTFSVSDRSFTMKIEPLAAQFNLKDGSISKLLDFRSRTKISQGTGGIYLIDGENGKELYPKRVHLQRVSANSISLSVDYGQPNLIITYDIRATSKGALWSVIIENKSNRTRLFEVRLGLPVDFDAAKYLYWDGFDHHYDSPASPSFHRCSSASNIHAINALPTMRKNGKRPKYPFSKNMIRGNVCIFPMTCIWSKDFGIAIGASPFTPISYYTGGVQPALSSYESFYYALKFVINPWAKEKQTFALYGFKARAGYRSALKRYYDLFPEAFKIQEDSPPSIQMPATGGYLSTLSQLYESDLGDLWAEFCRRYNVGWMWLYAPFQEVGEWFPNRNGYSVENWKRQQKSKSITKDNKVSRSIYSEHMKTYDEFLAYLPKIIAYAQKSIPIGWYIIPQRCSKNIADRDYRDSIVYRWGTRIPYFMRRGGVTGHPQYTVCALDTSFGDKTKEDLRRILKIAGPAGISFDNPLAFEHFVGNGYLKSSGRAFRDGTPYVVNNLAYRELERFVHDIDSPNSTGYKPLVFSNNPLNIASAMYTDASLTEYHPYYPADMVNSFAMLRYMLGPHKTISYKVHGGALNRDIVRKWDFKKHPLEEVYNDRLHSLLALFRWGALPRISEGMGSSDIVDAIPTLLLLNRAGWEPEPMFDFYGDRLWVERFGSGLTTYISVINHTEEPFEENLALDAQFGKGLYFFESIYGDPMDSLIEKGSSKISLSIHPVWLSVVRCFMNFFPQLNSVTGTASVTHSYEGGRRIDTIALRLSENTFAKFTLPLEGEVRDVKIIINGETAESVADKKIVRSSGHLREENTIEASYIEEIQIDPDPKSILDCDFLNENQINFTVSVNESLLMALSRKIENYFLYFTQAEEFERFYLSNGRTPPPAKVTFASLPVHMGEHRNFPIIVKLSVDSNLRTKGRISVRRDGDTKWVEIEGRNTDDLGKAVHSFLSLLDIKYMRFGYDGVFKRSPLYAGSLAPGGVEFKRLGWIQYLDYKKRLRKQKELNLIAVYWEPALH